ncbi:MAG: hypothetical protein ACLTT2_07440 [Alphaproteobacteria bacterium]
MRKELIASLSMLGSLAASGAAAAQTCATPPSCETLGFTKSEADCDGLEALKCPFDQSKLYCPQGGGNMSAAAPGAILYSDGTISDSVIASKTPVGIVAYVNGSTGFAVSLTEVSKTWSSGHEDVSCLTNYTSSSTAMTDMNGKTNTMCIVNYENNNVKKYSYPAAEYCHTYSAVSSGKGSSGWYLPAAGELYSMSFSYGAINLGLQKLSKTKISSDYYWSSSEYYYTNGYGHGNDAWVVRPSDGYMRSDYTKIGSEPVRCVIAL